MNVKELLAEYDHGAHWWNIFTCADDGVITGTEIEATEGGWATFIDRLNDGVAAGTISQVEKKTLLGDFSKLRGFFSGSDRDAYFGTQAPLLAAFDRGAKDGYPWDFHRSGNGTVHLAEIRKNIETQSVDVAQVSDHEDLEEFKKAFEELDETDKKLFFDNNFGHELKRKLIEAQLMDGPY